MATKKYHGGEESGSILINFVLDKSGSMDVIRDATISGFNEFKNDQAREDGSAFFTLTLFDTRFDTVANAIPVADIYDLTHDTYRPGGTTALYDAIAHTMRLTDEFVAEHHPRQVLFVIMTDGEENASREYRREQIFEMIRDRQDTAGYDFIYLGANQDSFAVGRAMGLREGRTMNYAHNPAAAAETMKRASTNVKAHRRMGVEQSAAFFSPAMDALGDIDAEAWRDMDAEERANLRKRVADAQ
jgi:uncharacterized protein YegL